MALDLAQLPGGDLIQTGLDDLDAGRTDTAEALLIAAAATRLRAAGVRVPAQVGDPQAEHAVYRALQPRHGNDAHGRYLALLRQVESFARAAEHAAGR